MVNMLTRSSVPCVDSSMVLTDLICMSASVLNVSAGRQGLGTGRCHSGTGHNGTAPNPSGRADGYRAFARPRRSPPTASAATRLMSEPHVRVAAADELERVRTTYAAWG